MGHKDLNFFDFRNIAKKWQDVWDRNKSFQFISNKEKQSKYIVEQFYYPSGKLHIGHLRLFTIGDVIARFNKLKGFNVCHPMGADAFGLPAENAAIEKNIHPKKWTYENIALMNSEIKKLGSSYDWNLTLNTCDNDYIKFEQKIFIDFFNKSLVYQAESIVNWDPVDNTVLSNEQVVDGKGWRSGAIVEQRNMKQWFMKITHYAEELLRELKNLNWTPKILKMQENWIGRSEGLEIDFEITRNENDIHFNKYINTKIKIFTTRPETIYGVSSVAISTEHQIAKELARYNTEISNFIKECKSGSIAEEDIAKREKKGICTNFYVKNPISQEEVPVLITNYVLMNYGTGAVMMVPAHDERDFECIKNCFPKIEIKYVIDLPAPKLLCYSDHGILKNSSLINNLHSKNDKDKIIDILIKNVVDSVKKKTTYKLRDWCISRQRYWGCPIPIIHCEKCGIIPEIKKNLPILLPDDNLVNFDGKSNPLESHPTWKNTKCHKCGLDARRDCNTMDTYVESSWYFLRYLSGRNNDIIFNKNLIENVLPVDIYLGGPEHATTHMLYARFFMKAMRDCEYFKSFKINKNCEPFNAFTSIGMVCHKTFQDKNNKYLYPNEVYLEDGKYYTLSDKTAVRIGPSIKMSKSKKNIIEPNDVIEKYGADVCRFFLLSDNPIDNDFDWTQEGLEASYKYIKKIFNFIYTINFNNLNNDIDDTETVHEFDKLFNLYLENFEKYYFNVSNAKFREIIRLLNDNLKRLKKDSLYNIIRELLIIINPVMPHLTEELWEKLNFDKNIIDTSKWPAKKIIQDNVKISVQINNKFKGFYFINNAEIEEKELLDILKKDEFFSKFLINKAIQNILYKKNQFINIIIH